MLQDQLQLASRFSPIKHYAWLDDLSPPPVAVEWSSEAERRSYMFKPLIKLDGAKFTTSIFT